MAMAVPLECICDTICRKKKVVFFFGGSKVVLVMLQTHLVTEVF